MHTLYPSHPHCENRAAPACPQHHSANAHSLSLIPNPAPRPKGAGRGERIFLLLSPFGESGAPLRAERGFLIPTSPASCRTLSNPHTEPVPRASVSSAYLHAQAPKPPIGKSESGGAAKNFFPPPARHSPVGGMARGRGKEKQKMLSNIRQKTCAFSPPIVPLRLARQALRGTTKKAMPWHSFFCCPAQRLAGKAQGNDRRREGARLLPYI